MPIPATANPFSSWKTGMVQFRKQELYSNAVLGWLWLTFWG